jgi:hypothetical protein
MDVNTAQSSPKVDGCRYDKVRRINIYAMSHGPLTFLGFYQPSISNRGFSRYQPPAAIKLLTRDDIIPSDLIVSRQPPRQLNNHNCSIRSHVFHAASPLGM